ncbi:MAG: gamma-butyrobetaine hydroxylase-like domain-containing protein [Phycisphaerales bacterium JB039]
MTPLTPQHLDLRKTEGLEVLWPDGRRSFYPIGYLRRMSPSADMRELRKQMERNPLTVLPASAGSPGGALVATGAELVGNYAIRITFSDGHSTGIYSWEYLRKIDPDRPAAEAGAEAPGS